MGDDSTMSGSSDGENFYKNHRGLLADSQSESYCSSDEHTDWGMTSDSCDDNFFNYSHNYFCSTEDLLVLPTCDDDDGDGAIDESPCKSNNVDGVESCTFRPSVHVRDNWGWCAGSCDESISTETSQGCYAGDSSTLLAPLGDDECDYQLRPSVSLPGVDPWVYYNGNIYVEPS